MFNLALVIRFVENKTFWGKTHVYLSLEYKTYRLYFVYHYQTINNRKIER